MPAGRQRLRKLTDSSGGVVSTTDTLVDVPASYTEVTLAAHIATLAAKINELIDIAQHDAK
jgi:hypothetical protein